jgi:hypothetical protein
MLRHAKHLERYELRARDGKILGQVDDFFFDDRHWMTRYLVVDTGSWLNSRKVLISPASVGRVEWTDKLISVNLTQEEICRSPSIDAAQPVTREQETALSNHYQWPVYWGAADVGLGMPLSPPLLAADFARPETSASRAVAPSREDHSLRSVRAVRGHTIEATDGDIGHVEDFLIDDRSWELRYMIVDTRNWWVGKQVVVAPQWIEHVGWNEARVRVELSRHAIRSSPAYDPERPLTPDYAGQLHDHYQRPRRADW